MWQRWSTATDETDQKGAERVMELANTIIIVTAWLAMLVSLVDIAFLVFLCKTFSKMIHEIVMLEKSPSNAEQAFLRAADKIKESTKC